MSDLHTEVAVAGAPLVAHVVEAPAEVLQRVEDVGSSPNYDFITLTSAYGGKALYIRASAVVSIATVVLTNTYVGDDDHAPDNVDRGGREMRY
jgi:hypothetical protein